MSDSIQQLLTNRPYVLLDGGLATELEARGAVLDTALWSAAMLERAPDLIAQIHFEYLAAGADILTTASYQATVQGFHGAGVSGSAAAALIGSSVTLAKQARLRYLETAGRRRCDPLIAASVGPYGAYLADGSEYRGGYTVTVRELRAFHRPQIEILLEAEPDILLFETIPLRREAEAIVDLLADLHERPALVSFSCRDGLHISDGERFNAAIADVFACPYILAAGLNCTSPNFVRTLLQSTAGQVNKPLLAYPNSGDRWDPGQRTWRPTEDIPPINTFVVDWLEAGAKIIGGCCGTSPATIASIRSTLDGAVGC